MEDELYIRINFPEGLNEDDLSIRYIFSDTLEARGIGTVVSMGTGEGFFDLNLILDNFEDKQSEIRSILESLNLLQNAELIPG